MEPTCNWAKRAAIVLSVFATLLYGPDAAAGGDNTTTGIQGLTWSNLVMGNGLFGRTDTQVAAVEQAAATAIKHDGKLSFLEVIATPVVSSEKNRDQGTGCEAVCVKWSWAPTLGADGITHWVYFSPADHGVSVIDFCGSKVLFSSKKVSPQQEYHEQAALYRLFAYTAALARNQGLHARVVAVPKEKATFRPTHVFLSEKRFYFQGNDIRRAALEMKKVQPFDRRKWHPKVHSD